MNIFLSITKFTTLIFAILFLNACAGTSHIKPLSKNSNNKYSESENILINSIRTESESLHKELKRRGLLFTDRDTNKYIKDLGQSLSPMFMKHNNALNFYIIKDATANAMALPNGNIYLNIGLLSVVETEAQLAAIIAHEISHVIQQHSLKSRLNTQETILAANIADIFLLGTKLSYIPAISNLASFSREQEKDADLMALKYLHKAGYDLNQTPSVFELFQTLPEMMTLKNSAYSSHPKNKERIKYIKNKIQELYTTYTPHHNESPSFSKVRKLIVETNIKIRLSNNQYELALDTLDQVEAYYNKAALIQFYRGEAFRLKAENPKQAADEIEWLYPDSKETKNLEYFIKRKTEHYRKAASLYNEALKINPELSLAYRGHGLLNYSNNNYNAAIRNLNKYLELNKKTVDSLYIKRLIRNANRKLSQ